jgi:hypothetical protein
MVNDPSGPAAAVEQDVPLRVASTASTRHQNILLAAALLTLHGAIAWGIGEWWSRGLLMAHFGLFLIWQPVWRGERRIPARHALLVLTLGTIFAFFSNWWLLAAWIAMLFGLIGGGVPGTVARGERTAAILAAVYLVTMLLMWVLPQLFVDSRVASQIAVFVRYGMPLLPVIILAIPGGDRLRSAPVIIDLFYTVVLFLLVVVLALGSFVIHQRQVSHGDYLLGVTQALMVIAFLMLGLSWLWNPRAGFSGIGTLLSRYLLGLGLPFEQRMRRLAALAESETRPEHFLRAALTDMLDLPWINGYAWVTATSSGEVGKQTGFAEEQDAGVLHLTMHAVRPLSPAILLHQKLLMQMVGHFYEAQRREQQRQQSAYTQAIYETGARLTHDVKNLLQSLRSICAAAEMRGTDEAAFRALVQRQLPHITQRLSSTIEKLKSPAASRGDDVDAAIWWQGLQARYAGRPVAFESPGIPAGMRLPSELFDSACDTLIENALYKVMQGAARQVRVILLPGPCLRVCDDGEPLPQAVAAELFRGPVPSESGLGVGLYQAAGFAEQSGYALVLAENAAGKVCFELGRRHTGA